MMEDKLKLLRQMREIVRTQQKIDSNHPHSEGISLFNQQKFDEAVQKFRQAVTLNPHFSFSHHYLGSALLETGEFAEAEKCLLQAAELNPHYAATYLYLGKIEAEKGNWHEAEKYYRQTLDLRPDFFEAMFGLAMVLLEIKNEESLEIVELLKKIIQTDYANDTGLIHLINLHPIEADFYLDLADKLSSHGQMNKAILLYRLAILANGDLPLAKLKLANILLDLGKVEEAANYLHDASNLPNQNVESYRLTGDLFFRQGFFNQAIFAYRQSLKLNADDAGTYKKIGDALARQNQFEEAKIVYNEAVKLGYSY